MQQIPASSVGLPQLSPAQQTPTLASQARPGIAQTPASPPLVPQLLWQVPLGQQLLPAQQSASMAQVSVEPAG
jgi:hypothetical protein